MKLQKISKEYLSEIIDQLIELDLVFETDDHWGAENFVVDLDSKWNNSFIAYADGIIVGFIICSIKNENVLHIHRLVIKKEYRGNKIGTMLITHIINNANEDLESITLKVGINNISAQEFYQKKGFNYVYSEANHFVYRMMI
ncbi:GNAT family N-acetyltransferase [Methanococcoides sp. SA1]|nr:GNAT family N-acetyltransferase [Methanococcoides sp. SA1]